VKRYPRQPEKFGGTIDDFAPLFYLRRSITEERSKEEYFQRHATDCPPEGEGAFQTGIFDPGEGFLLSAGGGDPEGHRGFCPSEDFQDEADEKQNNGKIRSDDTEDRPQSHGAASGKWYQDQNRNYNN